MDDQPGLQGALRSEHETDRRESLVELLDRNWAELLQELRVVQTGVQLLSGFLLTLPFQQRFQSLTTDQRNLYLVVVSLATASTALLVGPVPLHRILFRRHSRALLVSAAHYCALVGSLLLGLALSGVNLLVFDVVVDRRAGLSAGAATLAVLASLWLVGPLLVRALTQRSRQRRAGRRNDPGGDG